MMKLKPAVDYQISLGSLAAGEIPWMMSISPSCLRTTILHHNCAMISNYREL
nr:MAG TPA: hypothetical protein [Caudoviricetes sp.]